MGENDGLLSDDARLLLGTLLGEITDVIKEELRIGIRKCFDNIGSIPPPISEPESLPSDEKFENAKDVTPSPLLK